MIIYNRVWVFYIITLFGLTACSVTGSNDQSDALENGPFFYSLQGELTSDISADDFNLRSEWARLESESLNEVQAGLYASVRDTADGIDYWQRYIVTIVKYDAWPGKGEYSVADIRSVRNGTSSDFFVNLRSLYREQTVEGSDEEWFYLEDYVFQASSGSIEISTSSEEKLRGNFSLTFDLNEKRTWDTVDEIIKGPSQNVLTVQGQFDIDLTSSRVGLLSQF